MERIEIGSHPMQHRPRPVGAGQRPALVVTDGDQGELRPVGIDPGQVLQVQAPMQGGQGLAGHVGEEREMDHVGVEVDHVELVGAAAHLGDLGHVGGQVGLQRRGVQSDRLVAHHHQPGLGAGLAAGEQGNLVAQLHQGVGQVRRHPLGAAVEPGRDSFIERRNLGDAHDRFSFSRRPARQAGSAPAQSKHPSSRLSSALRKEFAIQPAIAALWATHDRNLPRPRRPGPGRRRRHAPGSGRGPGRSGPRDAHRHGGPLARPRL